jgi:competence protein ComEC
MRTYFSKKIYRTKHSIKLLLRRIDKQLNSKVACILIALIIGITTALSPMFILIGILFIYSIRNKKLPYILTTILLLLGYLYGSLFLNNLANLNTKQNTHTLLVLSSYQDYYEGYDLNSNYIVQIYSEADMNIFDVIYVEGQLKVNKTNPYYSLSRNTLFNISPLKLEVVQQGLPFIKDIKEYIINNLNYHLSEDASNFAKSLIFGDSSYVDKEVKEEFREIGILHVIALSGYNFILILNLVNSCLFFVDKRKRGLITIPFGIAYLLIAGLTNLSGLRALIFFILTTIFSYLGIYVSRTKIILISILFFLILNPLNIYSFSLVLSYSAYFGIIYASKIKGNRMKKLILEQITVSTFTLPTLILISTSFNLLSIVINIVLSPIVSLASVILVIAQVINPLLTLCNILIIVILEITSKLSEITLSVNGLAFGLILLALYLFIAKLSKIYRI